MSERKLLLTIVLVATLLTILVLCIPIPHRVFAIETTIASPIMPFSIGNLTLQLREFNLSFCSENQTYLVQVESADVMILSRGQGDNMNYSIDIYASNTYIQMPNVSTIAFSYLELHLNVVQRDRATSLSAEAFEKQPLWKHLANLINLREVKTV